MSPNPKVFFVVVVVDEFLKHESQITLGVRGDTLAASDAGDLSPPVEGFID